MFFVLFWMYIMSMTYKYKIAQNLSTVLRIVLLRGPNDQVLTETENSLQSPSRVKTISPKRKKKRVRWEKKQEKFSEEQTTRRKLVLIDSANRFNLNNYMKRADGDSFNSIAPNASILHEDIFGKHKFTNSLNESKYVIDEEDSMDVQLQGQGVLKGDFMVRIKKKDHH